MKFTNSIFQISNEGKCPFMESFSNLMNQDMRVEKAMQLLAIGAQLDIQNDRYGKLRIKLFKKYGEQIDGEEGKMKIKNENIPEFLEEMQALGNLEFEIPGEPVSLEGEKVTLKATDIIRLRTILAGVPEILPVATETESETE